MKRTELCAVGLALLFAACGGGADAKVEVKGTKKDPGAAAKPAAGDLTDDLDFDAEIISAEEAKAEAEAITPENADAEFEKLKQEIESGG